MDIEFGFSEVHFKFTMETLSSVEIDWRMWLTALVERQLVLYLWLKTNKRFKSKSTEIQRNSWTSPVIGDPIGNIYHLILASRL